MRDTTNLPTKTMEFPDYPFHNKNSFAAGREVLQYLEDYSNHYELQNYIKFFHHVKQVKPKDGKWELLIVDLPNNREFIDQCDAVAVCIGHYSVPRVGAFPGLESFQGIVQHSHSYRTPERFTNKTVLVCGGGPSGVDISFDLAKFASKVYFSHREVKKGVYPDNVEEVPVVKEVLSDHVVFQDGAASGRIDAILICTGYNYSFPFLSPECGITVVDGRYVEPLYNHLININHPTMAFIGIPFRTFIFPMFHQQVKFFLKSLSGTFQLPSRDEMMAELEEYVRKKQDRGIPLKFYHEIHDEVRTYIQRLESMASLEPLSPIYFNIFYATTELRKKYLDCYREANFEVVDDFYFKISGVPVDKEELISNKYHIRPVSSNL
ncbi:senecionine N-oxygenase-like isoform X2 [Macrosteles quadrilineatus]|uniref:senecionine N-oxygenase-like isoform X2 n=1 Tax=Macrosteles quadrilineatus TaxID=74068 RepID=UPI0023E14D7B|nr:senecionine N-oxygenase-like isoform X2 [Macrosteles quadrilineatus]